MPGPKQFKPHARGAHYVLAAALAALALLLWSQYHGDPVAVRDGAGTALVETAFRDRSSGIIVDASGTVQRLLPDDTEGSRHQRFILQLASGQTLLIAHNIDIAPRVPVEVGAKLQVRGQYEWNALGGVVHWTHHDPASNRPGGWIRLGNETFQ